MKRFIFILVMAAAAAGLAAQVRPARQAVVSTQMSDTAAVQVTLGTILDTIQSHVYQDSLPLVTFLQDPRIMRLVNRKHSTVAITTHMPPSSAQGLRGYRVQVFSSNDPRQGKIQATQMKQRMRSTFPMQNIYIVYQAPFWKVRLGDYHERADALHAASIVKQAYPSLKGEIYVVPDYVH